MDNLELRMYFLVPYNISEIQKGIQAGHAALDYAFRFGKTKLFIDFIKHHKTWIILNGGVTRKDHRVTHKAGEMNTAENVLRNLQIPYGSFIEPDLNNALTTLCFICDERVFDSYKYPDYEMYCRNVSIGNRIDFNVDIYKNWSLMMGGDTNIVLRDLIKDKRLA